MKIVVEEINIRFALEIIAIEGVILEVVKINKIDKIYGDNFNKTKNHSCIIDCYYRV